MAELMTTGICAVASRSRSWRQTSSPVVPGSWWSSRIRFGPRATRPSPARLGVARHGHAVAGLRQVALDHLADRRAVVDDQDQRAFHDDSTTRVPPASAAGPRRAAARPRWPARPGRPAWAGTPCAPSARTRRRVSAVAPACWPRSPGSLASGADPPHLGQQLEAVEPGHLQVGHHQPIGAVAAGPAPPGRRRPRRPPAPSPQVPRDHPADADRIVDDQDPVDDDPKLALHQRQLVQVIPPRHNQPGSREGGSRALPRSFVTAERRDLAEHAVSVRPGGPDKFLARRRAWRSACWHVGGSGGRCACSGRARSRQAPTRLVPAHWRNSSASTRPFSSSGSDHSRSTGSGRRRPSRRASASRSAFRPRARPRRPRPTRVSSRRGSRRRARATRRGVVAERRRDLGEDPRRRVDEHPAARRRAQARVVAQRVLDEVGQLRERLDPCVAGADEDERQVARAPPRQVRRRPLRAGGGRGCGG